MPENFVVLAWLPAEASYPGGGLLEDRFAKNNQHFAGVEDFLFRAVRRNSCLGFRGVACNYRIFHSITIPPPDIGEDANAKEYRQT